MWLAAAAPALVALAANLICLRNSQPVNEPKSHAHMCASLYQEMYRHLYHRLYRLEVYPDNTSGLKNQCLIPTMGAEQTGWRMEDEPSCVNSTSQARQSEVSAARRIYQGYVRLEAVYTWERCESRKKRLP
jgi:hypothetical protein